MQKTCANGWCKTPFEVTDEDLAFYDKVSPVFSGKKYLVPPPTKCPDCRMQRRIAFRNERSLYHRTCSATQKQIVSIYSPEKDLIVYDRSYWWGDQWDPCSFGEPFDPTKTVFQQFHELMQRTPFPNVGQVDNENCEYTNNSSHNKNCYLIFSGSWNENCMHSYWMQNSLSTVDCYGSIKNELCYECVDCSNSYKLTSSQNCLNCQESAFLFDCIGCMHCFGCAGLRNKQYHWLNEPLSKAKFEDRLQQWKKGPSLQESSRTRWEELRMLLPRQAIVQRMTENCSGNYIKESRRCADCFDAQFCEDCAHCQNITTLKDSMDVTFFGYNTELLYECNNVGLQSYRCLFCSYNYEGNSDLSYCYNVHSSKNCFACANMHHRQYCILNKQYSKEEYEKQVPTIIEKMRADKEWGEFFSVSLSPFEYNETSAQEFFPLTKNGALDRGWKWTDYEAPLPHVTRTIKAGDLPSSIEDVPNDILNWAIECDATNRPFKIIKQELDFYRQMQLPIPRLHPNERHRRRMALRNPRKLWDRSCDKCQKQISTSYAPERPEIVYCEECYLKEVY